MFEPRMHCAVWCKPQVGVLTLMQIKAPAICLCCLTALILTAVPSHN